MRFNFHTRQRRGATIVEGAIVLGVALLLVLGVLDMGLFVLRHNALGEAARRGARAAIVRGKSASELGTLGPAALEFTADADNDIAAACRAVLPTMKPSEVTLQVTWPAGENGLGDPVKVSVAIPHRFIVPFLSPLSELELRSSSTMNIAR